MQNPSVSLSVSIIAQSSADAATQVFFYLAIVVVVLLVGAVVILFLRRRMTVRESGPAETSSILSQMRQLRDSGQMSKEEFDRVKSKLVSKAQAELSAMPKPVDPNRRSQQRTNAAGSKTGLIVQDKGPKPDSALPDRPAEPD